MTNHCVAFLFRCGKWTRLNVDDYKQLKHIFQQTGLNREDNRCVETQNQICGVLAAEVAIDNSGITVYNLFKEKDPDQIIPDINTQIALYPERSFKT